MKKLTLKALSLLLVLAMALSFALVGCTDDNTDDDDDDGGKKPSTVTLTKENAEQTMIAAFEKLSEAKYFEGSTELYHADNSGYSQSSIITVTVQKDGDTYRVIGENKEIDDGEEQGGEDDAYTVRTYITGNSKYVTTSVVIAGSEFVVQENNYDMSDIINILTDELFTLPFETVVKNICKHDFTVTKNEDVYTVSLTLDSYAQYCSMFIEEQYDPDDHGTFNEFSGSVSFSVNKKGDLVGIGIDMSGSLEGMEFTSKINTSITNTNEDKTVNEPEWYTNKSFNNDTDIYELRGDVIFDYEVDRYGRIAFTGAFNNTYGEYESIEYYRILPEIGGEKVELIDGRGYISIKNLVVPDGITFDGGFNDENCTVFLEGEDVGLDFESPEFWDFYFDVKAIYAAGDWEMVDGIPAIKPGANPLYPSSGNDSEEVLPGVGGDDSGVGGETPDVGGDTPDIGGDTPDVGDDDNGDTVTDNDSAKFVGKWVSDFDFTDFFNSLMSESLGEMAGYFDFDDVVLTYVLEFYDDGTYKTQVDEASVNEYIADVKNAMRAGLTNFINDTAAQAGYPSGDAMCRAELGMTLEEYVELSVESAELENSLPIEDTKTSGRYKAENGKLYLAEDGSDFSSTNYTPYVFVDENAFEMHIPEDADMGDIDGELEGIYDMIIEMFPLVFVKIA